MITMEEIKILRELAREYKDIATDARQQDAVRRMYATNDLTVVRPPVLMDEIPWFEMDMGDELTLRTTDPKAQAMETYFRRAIYRRKHFACDALMTPYYPVDKVIHSTGNGLEVAERIIATNEKNNIVSHEYHDIIPDEETFAAKFHLPVITADPEADQKNMEWTVDVLGDTLEAKLQGVGVYYAPWDQIPRFHGVENCFVDMFERPEFMHAVIEKFTEAGETTYEQYEKLGLLDANYPSLHCTPSYVTGCPNDPDSDAPHQRKDLWFRSMAQAFTSVSPRMHYEFDVAYSAPMMKKFKYTYYGCCEALDNKLDMLRKHIPNLRKVGVTPWANAEVCFEQIRGDLVAAVKPNPAHVAIATDPAVIRAEIEKYVLLSEKYGTPFDYVLKDISTVGYKPQNLIVWAQTVSDVLDAHYGK